MDELTEISKEQLQRLRRAISKCRLMAEIRVYRERVYCYELYHQMRMLWPDQCRFSLNGELDKRGHPLLQQVGADFAKPDFLIHTPGDMSGNHAAIEVKSQHANPGDILLDLKKLSLFATDVGYERAMYLFYGYDSERALGRAADLIAKLGGFAPIELWVHRGPGEAAQRRL